MSFVFTEKPKSRESTENPRSITLHYVAGRGDWAYVRMYAMWNTPQMFSELFRKDLKLTPLGGGMWDVAVPYSPVQPPEPGEYRIRWEVSGETVKRTHAIQHITSYALSGQTAPDHKGAINVNQDGVAEGVDVPISLFSWAEDWVLPSIVANWAYAQVVKSLYGKVNSAAFRGFPAGEVRFDGATGGLTTKDPKKIELSYRFTQSDSAAGLVYGGISGVAKGGWEYAWPETIEVEDAAANAPAGKTIAVHVERVLYSANFSFLMIGS